MDKNEAADALASADDLASRMRQGGGSRHLLVFLLGIVMLVMTAVYGLLIQPNVEYALPVFLLLPFFLLVIYTATRPVLPRHYRNRYAVITASGAGIYSLTVTLGSVLFSGEPLWWVPGAMLCAVPFFLVGMLGRKAGRTPEART
ncbi:hypothetical protein ACFRMN_07145 [Streptomyces sp. NPDC056835]|uniref:hypothetical protein n=1 Tax=Streptomyces sp. NPDC056835 TaxID=3345956 RepID=UPI0036A46B1B